MAESNLAEQIKNRAEKIAEILADGNSAEIKRQTDGTIKVYEVSKKNVK